MHDFLGVNLLYFQGRCGLKFFLPYGNENNRKKLKMQNLQRYGEKVPFHQIWH